MSNLAELKNKSSEAKPAHCSINITYGKNAFSLLERFRLKRLRIALKKLV